MDAGLRGYPRGAPKKPVAALVLGGIGVVYLCLRLLLLRGRYFDTDELEHLHAALTLSHGNVLYKDFFEHHGPVLYLLLQPLVRLIADPIHLILAGRGLMLCFWIAILLLQWRLPRREASALERTCGLLFLCFFTTFSLKSLEIRPDVPAALILSGLLLIAGGRGRWMPFWLGMGVGVGLLTSLKLVYPAAGLLGAALWKAWKRGGNSRLSGFAAFLAAGLALPAAACLLAFWRQGALRDFYHWFALFNLHFKSGFGPQLYLIPSLRENPLLWSLALLGMYWGRRETSLVATLGGALVGLAAVPSVHSQYYILLGPLLSAFAAQGAMTLGALSRRISGLLLCLTLFSFAASYARQWRELGISNELQIERIRCVSEKTAPSARVLDIWTGESFHRPHAAYFWCLPEELLSQFDQAIVESELLAALRDPRTRGLIWSVSYFNQLPPPVVDFARAHYRDAGCGRLFLRK